MTYFVTAIIQSPVRFLRRRPAPRICTVFNNNRKANCDKKGLCGRGFWVWNWNTWSDLYTTWCTNGHYGRPSPFPIFSNLTKVWPRNRLFSNTRWDFACVTFHGCLNTNELKLEAPTLMRYAHRAYCMISFNHFAINFKRIEDLPLPFVYEYHGHTVSASIWGWPY